MSKWVSVFWLRDLKSFFYIGEEVYNNEIFEIVYKLDEKLPASWILFTALAPDWK